MTTALEQIQSANGNICHNIDALTEQRGLLSQNLLSQIRNLIEGVTVLICFRSPNAEFSYDAIKQSLIYIKSQAKLNFLGKFHKLIQKSASHYTLNGDASERLMLKYYEYLYRTRAILHESYSISILSNLENFPVDLDPSLREYHEKIAARIEGVRFTPPLNSTSSRYYIQKTRPFFVGGRVYYEVTFCPAINKVNKFDRIVGFTEIDVTDKYAATITTQPDAIQILGKTMPIIIIREWMVSIRPCEFDNFAKLFGLRTKARTDSQEYRQLMNDLTTGAGSLLDVIDQTDAQFENTKADATSRMTNPQIFPTLERARNIIKAGSAGCNILRYLLLRMNNQIIKLQHSRGTCDRLSHLMLPYSCIPFETMPYCTSLPGHNPRYWDIMECVPQDGRDHELLARRIQNNVENNGVLYTPLTELEDFADLESLISSYNQKLYYKHKKRSLCLDKGSVFITGYEDDTLSIIQQIQEYTLSGIPGYTHAVDQWIKTIPNIIDDQIKVDALRDLFSQSRVALIYGAAGTGKSTMVDYIAQHYNNHSKLFLAHTNPAIGNLKRKVTAQNSTFRTIKSQISKARDDEEYDLLIIDECSTVSNQDLLKVLSQTSFKLLVFVGDIYQIESIQFGNWFSVIRSFIPPSSIFELTTPFRTRNEALITFWNKVRNLGDDLAEIMAYNGYCTILSEALFERCGGDEIILCLNYDGIYGINNINRFLQSSNPHNAVRWKVSTYKVGDPVLFHETERFKPVIYNNLKGKIVDIQRTHDWIQFDIDLDRPVSKFDEIANELQWIEGSVVRFKVHDLDVSDEDDDADFTSVPFQVAYAVSIHKAQGLEYDSVKVVITDANEDDITHSIFYTAITRTRNQLRIFWTPETQQKVLERLHHISNPRDVNILASRTGLVPVTR